MLFLFIFFAFMLPTLMTDSTNTTYYNSTSPTHINRFVPYLPYIFVAVIVGLTAIIAGASMGGHDE